LEYARSHSLKTLYTVLFQNRKTNKTSLRGNSFFNGSTKQKWPIYSADRSYRMIWNIRVFIRQEFIRHGTISLFFTNGLFSILFVFCLSKHERLLNCLLHDSHGIRTSVYGHGGTDIQSLHFSWHVCISPLFTLCYNLYKQTVAKVHLSRN
jgi:hypothetical protein